MFSRSFLKAATLVLVSVSCVQGSGPSKRRSELVAGSGEVGSYNDCPGSGSGSFIGSGSELECRDNGLFEFASGTISWDNPRCGRQCDEWTIGTAGQEIHIYFPSFDIEDGDPFDLLTLCDAEGCINQHDNPSFFPDIWGNPTNPPPAPLQQIIMTAPVLVHIDPVDTCCSGDHFELAWEPNKKPFEVAVLMDRAYVDTRSEGPNILLSATGTNSSLTASAFDSVSSWVAALPDFDAALVPELYGYSPLSHDDTANIRNFVENGGTLVSASDDHGDNHDLLNAIFGWTTRRRYYSSGNFPRQQGAVGTCFDSEMGSPESLPDPQYVTYSDVRYLPPEATVLYGEGRQASVWGIGVGAGRVYMLAYDWHRGAVQSWDWVLHTALTCHGIEDIIAAEGSE